jgi:hypothetical protein
VLKPSIWTPLLGGAGSERGLAEDDKDEGKPKKTYGVQIALYTDLLIRLGVSIPHSAG